MKISEFSHYLRHYLPYGCYGSILTILINCIGSLDGHFDALSLLIILLFGPLCAFVCFCLSFINFHTNRSFFISEFSMIALLVFLANYMFYPDPMLIRQLGNSVLFSAMIYIPIKWMAYRIYDKEVAHINALIQEQHASSHEPL